METSIVSMMRGREVEERYPIGRFAAPEVVSASGRAEWLRSMGNAPGELRTAVDGLTSDQLNTPYREGGWTARQVAHHVADSHMNGYIRAKLILTEDRPTITGYSQADWAELPDNRLQVAVSLDLLESLHSRWVALLEPLDEASWQRRFIHAKSGSTIPLFVHVALYAWHGQHHTAQIKALRDRNDW